MKVSRDMVVGWLTLAAGILALPQFVALVPEGSLPFVACAAGLITLLLRWLSGALGANALSAAGLITLAAGVLSVPEFVAVIPVTYMPVITMVSALLTLASRYVAGQSATDPAKASGLLLKVG